MDISNMELIGKGAQADVYLSGNKAIKIFNNDYKQANAEYEAELQKKAYEAGLPVPNVFDITEINGRMAIIMEYVKGKPLGEIMLTDMGNVYNYLSISVDLQIKICSVSGDGFPSQKNKLEKNITVTNHLKNEQRKVLLHLLQDFKSDNRLCHGDFHVLNLIQTNNEIKIIDWVDASNGNITADVCRTYLLYFLYKNEIANVYLEIYCKKSKVLKKDVLKWLPVIAGARLNENVNDHDKEILLNLINK